MGNSRRGLAAGVNFIWDLPMTLVLSLRNITSHRRRLSKPEFNSIQIGSLVWIWMRCAPDAGAWRCHRCCPTTNDQSGRHWLPELQFCCMRTTSMAAVQKVSPAAEDTAEAPLLDLEAVERRVRRLETEPDQATLHELAKRDPNSLHQATVYYALVSDTGGPRLKYKLLAASYAIVALQAFVAIGIFWGSSFRTCNYHDDCVRGMWCKRAKPTGGGFCEKCKGRDNRECCGNSTRIVGECRIDVDVNPGMCGACTDDGGEFINYRPALRINIGAMMPHDWAALLLAAVVVSYGVFGEIRDATLCRFALQRICDEREVGRAWPWALHTLNYLRLFALAPYIIGCVMGLVVVETGNSIAICLNAVAILFLVEIDNLAFTHALDESLRIEAEQHGRILLTVNEARIVDAIKAVCVFSIPVAILVGVRSSDPWVIVGVCAPFPCMVVALVQSVLEAKDRWRGFAWGVARGLFGWLVYYYVFFSLPVITGITQYEHDEQVN